MNRPILLDRSFWRDPRLEHRPPRARLLWLALLFLADDRGRVDVPFVELANLVLPSRADAQMLAALRKDLERMLADGLVRWRARRDKPRCLMIADWDDVFTNSHRASSLPRAARYAAGAATSRAESSPYKQREADRSLSGQKPGA